MASKIGIREWTEQRIISRARVAFDPRTTAQVANTRSDKNYKVSEQWLRIELWKEREAKKHPQKPAA